MIAYEIIQYFLVTVLGFLLGYQVLLSLFSLKAQIVQDFHTRRNRNFAIVVPAHNEEKVIAKTLYSLFGLVYPANRYKIIVVADNCSDNTARIARELGAKVLERSNGDKKGKGYALRYAFDHIMKQKEKYDGVVVFDSDSLVSSNYLEVMNYYFENGSRVIQSSDLVLPKPGAWSSESTRIGFLLYNYVKPMGRKALNLNMGLRGNGMCFSSGVLRDHPWQAWSLTEDVEYGLHLQLKGFDIDFAPEASVWAQMPVQPDNAESQRKRWEMGRYPVVREYAPRLLNEFFKTRSVKYLDAFIDLITPPLVNTLLFVLAMCVFNMILWLIGWIPGLFVWMWLGLAALGGLHLFVGLYAAGADDDMYKSILYIPKYAYWKIKVYVKTWMSDKEKRWIRTTRETLES